MKYLPNLYDAIIDRHEMAEILIISEALNRLTVRIFYIEHSITVKLRHS